MNWFVSPLINLKENRKEIIQVPVSGNCPTCEGESLWGDLIKKKKGCYSQVLQQLSPVDEEDEEIY